MSLPGAAHCYPLLFFRQPPIIVQSKKNIHCKAAGSRPPLYPNGGIFLKINWRIRLRNPAFLLSMISFVLSFVYEVLALFGVIPAVAESDILRLLAVPLEILTALGILIDPTAGGMSDRPEVLGQDETAPSTDETEDMR